MTTIEKVETEEEEPWAEWTKEQNEKREKAKNRTFLDKLRARFKRKENVDGRVKQKRFRWRKMSRPSIGSFDVFGASVVFIVYLFATVTVVTSTPIVLVLFIPTMYYLLDYIKLKKRTEG